MTAHATAGDAMSAEYVSKYGGKPILRADHPLAGVFAIGTAEPTADRVAEAERLLGFHLGEEVRVICGIQTGRTGTVVTLNPADREIGVGSGPGSNVEMWFAPEELVSRSPDWAPRRPLASPQTPGTGERPVTRPRAA